MSGPAAVWLACRGARRSWPITRNPLFKKNIICGSQSSEDRGQPCENTMGCPLPQSLKNIVTPSLVLIVSLFSVALILVSPVWCGRLAPGLVELSAAAGSAPANKKAALPVSTSRQTQLQILSSQTAVRVYSRTRILKSSETPLNPNDLVVNI